jgi:hypothetical protein
MAITCPRCGSEFDATLFQFGHRVRCRCGAEIEYPGTDQRSGHVLAQSEAKAVTIAATTAPKALDPLRLLEALLVVCQTEIMQAKLKALADGLEHEDDDSFVIARVGTGIRASQAVAAAL